MFNESSRPSHDAGRSPFYRGGPRGHWGPPPHEREDHPHFGAEGHEHGHPRWHRDAHRHPHWEGPRPPFARGHHFGPPWMRGGWHHTPEQEQARAAVRGLRSSVAGLIALLRAADERQVGQIQAVLDDARRRVAAILAEAPTPPTTSL